MPWVKVGATIKCQECSKEVPKKAGNHTFCAECGKARIKKSHNTCSKKRRWADLGRVCKECQASDKDKTWGGQNDLCSACSAAITRGNTICKKCNHIGGSLGCVYCTTPTPGRIDVTLISLETERQRVVRRHISNGRVKVGSSNRQAVDEKDPVLWVSHEVFLSAKR